MENTTWTEDNLIDLSEDSKAVQKAMVYFLIRGHQVRTGQLHVLQTQKRLFQHWGVVN